MVGGAREAFPERSGQRDLNIILPTSSESQPAPDNENNQKGHTPSCALTAVAWLLHPVLPASFLGPYGTLLGGRSGGEKKEQVTGTRVLEGRVLIGQDGAPFQNTAEKRGCWGPRGKVCPPL